MSVIKKIVESVEFFDSEKPNIQKIIYCQSALLQHQELKSLCEEIKKKNPFGPIETTIEKNNIVIRPELISENNQNPISNLCLESALNTRDEFIRNKMKWDKEYKRKITESSKIIFVVGKTGEGKSTLLNCLVDHKTKGEDYDDYIFETSIEQDSCTKKTKSSFFIFTDDDNTPHNIIVVDTPGLDDSDGEDSLHYFKILNQILEIGFVHSFIFVKKSGNLKFANSEQQFFRFFCDALGKSLTQDNCCLVFTDFDRNKKKQILAASKKQYKSSSFQRIKEMKIFKKKSQKTEKDEFLTVQEKEEIVKKEMGKLNDEFFVEEFIKNQITQIHSKIKEFPNSKGFTIDSLSANSKEQKKKILYNVIFKERIKYHDFKIKKTEKMLKMSKKRLKKLKKEHSNIMNTLETIQIKLMENSKVMELIELKGEEKVIKKKISYNQKELMEKEIDDYHKAAQNEVKNQKAFKVLFFVRNEILEIEMPKDKEDVNFDCIQLDCPKSCKMQIKKGGKNNRTCSAELVPLGLVNFGNFEGKVIGLVKKRKYYQKKIQELKKENAEFEMKLETIKEKMIVVEAAIDKTKEMNYKKREELLSRKKICAEEIIIEEAERCNLRYFKDNLEK